MIFKNKKKKNIFLYNVKLLILGISVIMIWRGIWNLLDEYLIPDYFLLSNLFSIALGVLILFLNDYDLEELGVGDD